MASILLLPKSKIKGIFSQRDITTIRINGLKGDPAKIEKTLLDKGYDLESIDLVENAFFVLNKDKSEISRTEEYEEGLFYIQNLSSMLPSSILNPEKEENILDMCAAPGSKTTHLADIMQNNGNIVANDIDQSRTSSLRNVINQFGVKNTKVMQKDGKYFGDQMPVSFDKVLLDAPCSGEGLIYLRGKNPLRFWSINRVKRYANIQKELIESAFISLKHGGTMIYSTCTLEPEENEGVITYLLKNYPNARLEEIDIEKKRNMTSGITKWSGNNYDKSVVKSIRILPNSKMMGFYIAKIFKE